MTAKILVIEDDQTIGDVMTGALQRAGYEVKLCRDGEEGFFQALTGDYDLLLLDVVLPGRNGLEILVGLRKHNQHIPVMMLSTKDDVDDRVKALSLHADDYLGKPFALSELLARVQAMLRRNRPAPPLKLTVGDLQLDLITREVTRATRVINLTLRECEMLEYLMRQNGRIVSRAMLAQNIWKGVERVTTLDNVIDVHISRLRRKIEAPGRAVLLRTVRGVGFRLSERDADNTNLGSQPATMATSQ